MSFNYKIVLIIYLLLLLPRLWILFNSSYTFYSDDAIYATLAKNWTTGEWQNIFHPTWPPLYPLFSALFSLVVPTMEDASRLSALIFGTAVVIPLFFLLKPTLSLSCAVSFCLAIFLFTTLTTMSLLPLSDSLSTFLIICGIVSIFFALSGNIHHQRKTLVAGSFFFGLTFLTRAEGTMFFFLTTLFLILYFFLRLRVNKSIRPFLPTLMLFILVFLLTASPYIIATRVQTGEWSLSQKFSAQIQQGHSFAINKYGTTWSQEIVSAKSPNYKSLYFKNGTDYLLNRLPYFLHIYPQKQQKWQQIFLTIFPVWSIPLILIGAAGLLNKKYRWATVYLVYIFIMGTFMTIFSTPVADVRYLLWNIPILLFLFYSGVKIILRNGGVSALTAFIAVLTFPGVSLANISNPSLVAAQFTQSYNKSELRLAGEWIKNNTESQNPKIMARHEGVEFYSGGETIYLPQLSYNQVLVYAKKNAADYLIAWDEELGGDKKLAFLLNSQINHPGIQNVYSVKGRGQIIVYKFRNINSIF